MIDKCSFSLLNYNTFGIDAKCNRFVEYESVEEACSVAKLLQNTPYLIIGGGSNLLLTKDFEGTVVHSAIRGIERLDDCRVRCGSGEVWDDIVAWCIDNGLYGAENLSLIPGEVGASAVQNIGAYGAEVKDLIETVEAVEIVTGQLHTFSNAECQYGYRDSRFKHEWKNRFLVTHVTYRLSTTERLNTSYGNISSELERLSIMHPTARQLRQVIIDIRNAKLPDPKVIGNAGSFFMNPVVSRRKLNDLEPLYPTIPYFPIDNVRVKIPAGWLIEQCGWKGRSLGPAGVHDRQALVLVNRGGATGNDIVCLCRAIQNDVQQKFGIEIHPEVNIV